MTYVRVRNGDLEGALKAFRKKVNRAGIIKEFKRAQRFEKPSTVRRHKRQAAERRRLRRNQ